MRSLNENIGWLILCFFFVFFLFGLTGTVYAKRAIHVKVVNEPFVKAEQEGFWSMTINNDKGNPVPITADNLYRFVGLSTNQTVPNIGFNGMHQLCQSDFGDTARMCTTKELFETPDLSSFPSGGAAWIQPVIAGVIYYPPTNNILYVDVTGESFFDPPFTSGGTAGSAGTCGTWLTANSDATGVRVVDFSGSVGISATNCAQTYPVACCDIR